MTIIFPPASYPLLVYLSGPISGLSEAEYTTRFADAASVVYAQGHNVLNPLSVGPDCMETCNNDEKKSDGSYLHSWKCYMKADIIAMFKCDAVVALPGWENSKGATVEINLAKTLEIPVYCVEV